jgi:hypothetical protein
MSRSGPQRYQYGYEVGAPSNSASEESYSAWARGDLDGDGRSSLFRLRGEVIETHRPVRSSSLPATRSRKSINTSPVTPWSTWGSIR